LSRCRRFLVDWDPAAVDSDPVGAAGVFEPTRLFRACFEASMTRQFINTVPGGVPRASRSL
jgi:hypothetical protein